MRRGWLARAALLLLALTLAAAPAPAQDDVPAAAPAAFASPLEPLDTSSPRATLASLERLGAALDRTYAAYVEAPSFSGQRQLRVVLDRVGRLFDLSETPIALQGEAANAAFGSLKDVLMRMPAIGPGALPGDGASAPARVRLPGTEIEIARIEEGPRRGDFLFSADTVERLPGFRARIIDFPILNPAPYDSWREAQVRFTGPLVPSLLMTALPVSFDRLLLGTPAWKIVATVAVFALTVGLASRWAALALRRAAVRQPLGAQVWRLSIPVVACALFVAARGFVLGQINLSGMAFHIGQAVSLAAVVAAAGWIARTLILVVAEFIVATPAFRQHSYDAHLARLIARVAGLLAAAAVIVYGANLIGVPLLGLVAGVGVGGFALALAAQSTVENLFGGVSIFADRPFRVGDFIIYNGGQGYVETIGPRSTRIRALDGMQITMPNAELAKMQLTNRTCRDSTLFRHVLSFTYESPRPALAEFSRRMRAELIRCPIDAEAELPPWVRIVALGPSSIDVELRADLRARNEDDFSRQQEALLVTAMELAEACGLRFAFPTSTVHLRPPVPAQPALG